MPLLGVQGYGFAELFALPGYVVLLLAFQRQIGEFVAREVLFASLVAGALATAAWWPPAPLLLFGLVLLPVPRRAMLATIDAARRGLFARSAA